MGPRQDVLDGGDARVAARERGGGLVAARLGRNVHRLGTGVGHRVAAVAPRATEGGGSRSLRRVCGRGSVSGELTRVLEKHPPPASGRGRHRVAPHLQQAVLGAVVRRAAAAAATTAAAAAATAVL